MSVGAGIPPGRESNLGQDSSLLWREIPGEGLSYELAAGSIPRSWGNSCFGHEGGIDHSKGGELTRGQRAVLEGLSATAWVTRATSDSDDWPLCEQWGAVNGC